MAHTTFLLVRHGAHLLGGETIAGRSPGVLLSPLGREQVVQTAERIAAVRPAVQAIYTSPVERCRQTSELLREKLGVPLEERAALSELDFGRWTRKALSELRQEEEFRRWNAHRSGTRMPDGELMLEVQLRIVGEMIQLRDQRPGDTLALVTHGDVIKAAVGYALGAPLDLLLRIEISPASVTVIAWGAYGPWVLGVNGTGRIEMPT